MNVQTIKNYILARVEDARRAAHLAMAMDKRGRDTLLAAARADNERLREACETGLHLLRIDRKDDNHFQKAVDASGAAMELEVALAAKGPKA